MTRSPIVSTLCALIPLAALAIPLSRVLSPDLVVQVEVIEPLHADDLVRADILLKSAHPFEQVTVNGVLFLKGEEEKEVRFDPSQAFTIGVTWPAGTPESALQLEIIPDGLEIKSHTLWGSESAKEEIQFSWEEAP